MNGVLGMSWLVLGLASLACSGSDGSGAARESGGTGGRTTESGGSAGASTGGTAGAPAASGGVAGSSPSEGAAGRAVEPDFEQLTTDLAEAYCDAITSCIPSELVGVWLGTPNCATLMETRIENGFVPALERGLEDGTLEYDDSKLSACLDAIRQEACQTNAPEPPACDAALRGTVPEGGDCRHDAECADDRVCIVDGICPGQCTDRLADGETCTRDDDCGPGSVCFEAECTPEPAEGDPCTKDGIDCAGGLACLGEDEETGEPGACRPFDEVFTESRGDACDFATALCEPDSVCAIEIVDDEIEFRCEPHVESGGDCRLAAPDMCPIGEYCADTDVEARDVEGTCTPLPGNDEPCVDERCAGNHVCVAGTCVRLKENGEDCATHEECYSERCTEGVCSPDTDCAP